MIVKVSFFIGKICTLPKDTFDGWLCGGNDYMVLNQTKLKFTFHKSMENQN